MNKRLIFMIGSALALVLGIACLVKVLPFLKGTPVTEQIGHETSPALTVTTSADAVTSPSDNVNNVTEPTQTPYSSPIPFDKLKASNPDIYAWIKVPGTSIDYPILQHPTDDTYYLDHDSDKTYHPNGAIFSERVYNSTDFTDAVTVLYGHDMMSGEMFGELQSLYWDMDFLLENDDITIYLPDREIHFEIFAALPYSRMHLLYYYHTNKKSGFDLFIEDVYDTRKLSALLLEERRPSFGDQVVVLSTCLAGDNRYRYLVMGVCKNT